MTSLLQAGIDRYRKMKRNRILSQPFQYKKKYAIIGAGQHHLNNLFPCLWHLGVPVKWVGAKSRSSAEKAAFRWKDCTGTDQLDSILQDPDVAAVFISTQPEQQAGLAARALQHQKHVFVEKPVGFSLSELQNVIAAQKDLVCQPAMQRRFAPLTLQLKNLVRNPISYNYRFLTGSYPEGAVLYELFLHPLDFVTHLFGPASVLFATTTAPGSFLVALEHKGVKGVVELATAYNWKTATDEICINTGTQVIEGRYPNHLKATAKPRKFGPLPLEKVIKTPLEENRYLSDDFVPVPEAGSHYRKGFYPQLEHFVRMVEENKTDERSRLQSLVPAYDIIEAIRKQTGV